MESAIKEGQLRIGGMTCVSCQNKIEKKLRNTAGVKSATVSYSASTAEIVYDTDIITLKDIEGVIEKLDYSIETERKPQSGDKNRMIGLLLIIASLYLMLDRMGILNRFAPSQLADASMGYGMLFFIGLLTSVHCIAMCGGINLSQCMPGSVKEEGQGFLATLKPALFYNLGRVISYTAVGFVVGGLGSVVTFSTTLQGMLKLIAGVFMILMGINTLGIFPSLRKFNLQLPRVFSQNIDRKKADAKSPLYVGLLNGLMPCGPLQAMQIYALSTGSPVAGAFSMFLFSLGTVPLMLGLGAISLALGKKSAQKIMGTGGVLVVVLGLSMFSQGMTLSGFSLPWLIPGGFTPTASAAEGSFQIEDGVQIVNSTLSSGRYPAITVQAGMPVKWIIDAPQGSVNGCNNRMFIPEYNIEYQFKTGENIIEFTPSKTGSFSFSCWMGMIRSSIQVVEAGSDIPVGSNSTVSNAPSAPIPADYTIPTDEIAVATQKDGLQQVSIKLTDEGFQPAVVVVQSNLETEWLIENESTSSENTNLLVPYYATQVPLAVGENPIYLYPTGDFDFSNGGNTNFGYVKVVEDINKVDLEQTKEEVSAFAPSIWPQETFNGGGGSGASCH